MSRFENHLKKTIWAVAVTLAFTRSAAAETVEVAPGVQVTKRTYTAPINEQPFFGFAVKDSAQQAADANFVNAIIKAAGTREKAFEEAAKRGWRAVNAGRMGEAAQRFNQAFLISPATHFTNAALTSQSCRRPVPPYRGISALGLPESSRKACT